MALLPTAPCVVDGPINGAFFRASIEQFLVSALQPGDSVVLDNLVRDAGAKLAFLPPYSPDLNPIEQVFAKVKHWMRMAQARSTGGIHDCIANLAGGIPEFESANYIRNADYAAPEPERL